MKKLIVVGVLSLIAAPAFCEVKTTKLDLSPVAHYIASPQFGKALAEATAFAKGWKIRIVAVTDDSRRTTSEKLVVTVVGNEGGKYRQAVFEIEGINGGWHISPVAESKKMEITQAQFVNFEE